MSARGLDYPDVTFVLQIGSTNREQYIHRLGRTARAGKGGCGMLLLAPFEEKHMISDSKAELKDMPIELASPQYLQSILNTAPSTRVRYHKLISNK